MTKLRPPPVDQCCHGCCLKPALGDHQFCPVHECMIESCLEWAASLDYCGHHQLQANEEAHKRYKRENPS